jgi:chromosome segregation ATPase
MRPTPVAVSEEWKSQAVALGNLLDVEVCSSGDLNELADKVIQLKGDYDKTRADLEKAEVALNEVREKTLALDLERKQVVEDHQSQIEALKEKEIKLAGELEVAEKLHQAELDAVKNQDKETREEMEKVLQKSVKERNDLLAQINDLNEERQRLSKRLTAAEDQVNEAVHAQMILKVERAGCQVDMDSLVQDAVEKNALLKEMRRKQGQSLEAAAEAMAKVRELGDDLQLKRAEVMELKQAKQDINQTLENLQEQLSESHYHATLAKIELMDLTAEKSTLMTELREAEKKMRLTGEERDNLEALLAQVRAKNEGHQEAINALEEENATLSETVVTLETLKAEMGLMKSDYAAAKTELTLKKDQLASAEAKLSLQQSQLVSKEQKANETEALIFCLEQKLASATEETKEVRDELATLDDERKKLLEQREAVEKSHAEATTSLQAQVNQLEVTVEELKANDQSETLATLRNEVYEAGEKLNELERQLADNDLEMINLEAARDKLKENLAVEAQRNDDRRCQELAELTEANERLQGQLKIQAEEAEQELERLREHAEKTAKKLAEAESAMAELSSQADNNSSQAKEAADAAIAEKTKLEDKLAAMQAAIDKLQETLSLKEEELADKESMLQAAVNEAFEKVTKSQVEAEEALEEVNAMKTSLFNSSEAQKKLQAEVDALKEELIKRRCTEEESATATEELQSQVQRLEEQLAEKERAKLSVQGELESARAAAAAIEAKAAQRLVEACADAVAKVEAQYTDREATMKQDLSSLQVDVEEKAKELAALQEDMANTKAALNAKQDELSKKELALRAVSEKNEAAAVVAVELRQRLETLERDLTKEKTDKDLEMAALKSEVAESVRSRQQAEKRVQELEHELSQLLGSTSVESQKLAAQMSQKEQLAKELKERLTLVEEALKDAQAAAKAERDQLMAKLEEANCLTVDAETKADEALHKLESHQKNVSSKDLDLQNAEKVIDQLKAKLCEADQTRKENEEMLKEADLRVSEVEDQAKELTDQMKGIREKLAHAQRERDQKQQDLDAEGKKCQELQEDIDR